MLEYGQIKIVAQRLRNISHIQRSYEITKNEENEVILGSNKITFYNIEVSDPQSVSKEVIRVKRRKRKALT